MARRQSNRRVGHEAINLYRKVSGQVQSFYEEIGALSKKKPDDPLNTFKLKFINQAVKEANQLLGDEYRPFPDFESFDLEEALPTASDVVMMLSLYKTALAKFYQEHTFEDVLFDTQWNVEDSENNKDDDATDPE